MQLHIFDTHEARAHRWMEENPDAMRLFERLAIQKANMGHRFGMKHLAEVVRWEYALQYEKDDFKVNNNYIAYIGRELVKHFPILGKYISTRQAGLESRKGERGLV